MNYAKFQVKIDVSRVISVIKDFICLVSNSSKSFMQNDKFYFNVFKFRWEISSSGWVKINTYGVDRGSPSLANCGGIFCGSMREFIGGFSVFLDVQTALFTEFYGVIHAIEQVQNMSLTSL